MPAKKKPAKTAPKAKAKPAAKPKKVEKKPAKAVKKPAPKPVAAPPAAKPIAPPPPPKPQVVQRPPVDPNDLVDCEHCDATGKCASGQPYDKSHHQGIFSNVRLTSCIECLVAAGESHNSKKLVDCRFCQGSGKVEKPRPM